ncbi:FAD-binding oxidoreductase [Chloroflexota bacterium]
MRSYIKGIDTVMPTGEVLRMGGKLLKNNTGYDLMHLIIGSEGTLAVVTKVILRLFPPDIASATMIMPYNDRHAAINTVPQILQSGIIPMAIEYMDRGPVELSAEHLNMEWPCKTGTAYLMIIVVGNSKEEVYLQCERISEICERHSELEALVGETRKEQDRVLKIRSNVYLAVKRDTADFLDVAVPPANMGKLMDAIDEIAERHGTVIPMVGHAGDGNLHPVLMRDLVEKGSENLKEAKREVYRATVELGGIMTAEHGVGRVRIPDADIFLDKKEIELMRGIKKVFDPNGILNPGCAIRLE